MIVYLAGTYAPICYLRDTLFGGDNEGVSGGDVCTELLPDGRALRTKPNRGVSQHVNLLESYYYLSSWQVEHIHDFKRFMLDSGAFTLAISRKGSLGDDELRRYVSRYAEFVATHDVTHYFEVDIDHVKGTDWVRRTTDWIERETGKTPIPVWHPCRGAKGFEAMCERYPYVAIGTTDIRKQLSRSVGWFTQTAHRYGAKIHGLGYTKLDGLSNTGFDSVDSTAWLYGNLSGCIYQFDGAMLLKHKAPKGKKVKTREACVHNFTEWARFAKHMEAR